MSAPSPSAAAAGRSRLGVRQFDDLQFDTVVAIGLGRLLADVALVDVGEIDGVTGGGLHCLRQTSDLGAGVGGRDVQRQEIAQLIDGQWTFEPLSRFAPS
jgi:hypothetical protein